MLKIEDCVPVPKNDKNPGNPKLSTEEFIRRAIKVHGNRYDYSEAKYTGYNDKIAIICKEHGIFHQKVSNHLGGGGCHKCRNIIMAIKKNGITTESFIKRAAKIHKDKYDYSLTQCFSARDTVTVICPNHGEFTQVAFTHLKGSGCLACAREKRFKKNTKTTEQFIEDATTVHGVRYDYKSVVYVSATSKVKIVCRKHGEFLQSPTTHLKGAGCPECGRFSKRSEAREKLFAAGVEKFGGLYEYKVNKYRAYGQILETVCKIHGAIKLTFSAHIKSMTGCLKCDEEQSIKTATTAGVRCLKCGIVKSIDEFPRGNKKNLNIGTYCKSCVTKERGEPCRWNTYGPRQLPGDNPTNIDGILHVACKKCGRLFPPTLSAVSSRERATKNTNIGENNYYCSESCKNSCDLFGKKGWSNYDRGLIKRKCQKGIKDSLLELQCDEVGYQYCERCGDIIPTDLHHSIEVAKYGTEKAHEPASMVLLCPQCHILLHRECK